MVVKTNPLKKKKNTLTATVNTSRPYVYVNLNVTHSSAHTEMDHPKVRMKRGLMQAKQSQRHSGVTNCYTYFNNRKMKLYYLHNTEIPQFTCFVERPGITPWATVRLSSVVLYGVATLLPVVLSACSLPDLMG